MLSETEVLITPENPCPIRIRFRKVGMLQYISHLDLQRTFEKALIRAGIPAWFTQGFNPHTKMVFSLPLSIGAESDCEYLDIKIVSPMPEDEIKRRLNAALTDEMAVLDVYRPVAKMADIGWARYTLTVRTEGAGPALADAADALFRAPSLIMTKRSKSGDKEVDILPLIRDCQTAYDAAEDLLTLDVLLSASPAAYLNPEVLISALREHLGILSHDLMREWYTVVRRQIYLADGVTPFR